MVSLSGRRLRPPDFQNVPTKSLTKTEPQDYIILDLDYSEIELRILALGINKKIENF